MHWFEGQEEDAVRRVIANGYYVSFGPALLYSKRLPRLAGKLPEERLLVESDGPVAFGALGGARGPDTIASVLFRLAQLQGREFAEMATLIEDNVADYLIG